MLTESCTCISRGSSAVHRSSYSHGRTTLLAIQVDAAINSGNSGGPVLLGDHVVGIAFQCLTSGENIGCVHSDLHASSVVSWRRLLCSMALPCAATHAMQCATHLSASAVHQRAP